MSSVSNVSYFISGGAFVGFLVIGVFFLRFWKKSHDRLFATFAVSFFMMAIERVLVLRFTPDHEAHALIYCIRLIAFILIVAAVAEKNRAQRPSSRRQQTYG